MKLSQHIVVEATDGDALLNLIRGDSGSLPDGITGVRLLRFRDKPNKYLIQVDFHSSDSAEAASRRPETQNWAKRLKEMSEGEPEYEDLNVVYERST